MIDEYEFSNAKFLKLIPIAENESRKKILTMLRWQEAILEGLYKLRKEFVLSERS
jgi:hypothetical protein